MNRLTIFIFLFISVASWSQDVKTILTKVNATYSGKNISYKTKYELFKGHKSNDVHSFYQGEVLSFGNNVYQKIDKTEFVYTEKFSVKVNADERSLVVLPGKQNVHPELDLDLALKDCASSKVIDKGSYYQIVLSMKAGSSLQCSVVKLEIDKSKFTLNQIDIYYSFFQDFSTDFAKEDLQQPHMRIKFSSVNLNAPTKESLFAEKTYFTAENGALKPAAYYSAYNLYDNR